MFSPEIVGSDAFIEMPVTTQCLYFHLAMRADDDGFVNPNITMRMVGANSDDLKVLIAKRFLLQFQNGVVVVKHWRINNFIRKDRYKPTTYLDERSQLRVKENMSYTLDPNQGKDIALVPWKSDADVRYLNGQPDDSTTVNTGKVRIGKVRIDNTYTDEDFNYDELFTSFWKTYPKKTGKGAANKSWKKLKPSKAMTEKIVASVVEHSKTKQWQKENGQFIPNPATFLNQRRWEDEINEGTSASSRDPKYNSVNVRSA